MAGKPFKWLGTVHARSLWLDLADGTRKVIAPGGVVKKAENLQFITLERQKQLEAEGALVFLTFGKETDGTVEDDGAVDDTPVGANPMTREELDQANATVSNSVATSKALAKNANIAADAALDKAIENQDKREKSELELGGVGSR